MPKLFQSRRCHTLLYDLFLNTFSSDSSLRFATVADFCAAQIRDPEVLHQILQLLHWIQQQDFLFLKPEKFSRHGNIVPISKLILSGATYADVSEAFLYVETSSLSFLDMSNSSLGRFCFLSHMNALEHLDLSSSLIDDNFVYAQFSNTLTLDVSFLL
ncbi:hypothetical protein ACSBR2_008809 [Camellia fascicularis]